MLSYQYLDFSIFSNSHSLGVVVESNGIGGVLYHSALYKEFCQTGLPHTTVSQEHYLEGLRLSIHLQGGRGREQRENREREKEREQRERKREGWKEGERKREGGDKSVLMRC